MKSFFRVVSWVFAILLTISLLAFLITQLIKATNFDNNCLGYIKRATITTNAQIAKEELEKAIHYLEENNITQGSTKVICDNPSYNVGFWYKNLKDAYFKLDSISEDASILEESNVLMQVQESLTYKGSIFCPSGISTFPHNIAYFWWGILSFILAAAMWIFILCTEVSYFWY